MEEAGIEQYGDMPREIFNQILKFSTGLDVLCNLRKHRKKKKADIIYHYAHRINGDRMAMNGSERRAQYCCDKLQEERKEFYKTRDRLFQENLALREENEAQRTQLAAIDSKLKELEAKFRPSEPSSPQKAGVNQENAPPGLI